ncbi:MAG: hypothetical protein WEB59_01955 [Thermoanaerobaculia bacterium]
MTEKLHYAARDAAQMIDDAVTALQFGLSDDDEEAGAFWRLRAIVAAAQALLEKAGTRLVGAARKPQVRRPTIVSRIGGRA